MDVSDRWGDKPYWTRVQPGVVARVDPVEQRVLGVFVYGEVSSERLREVNVRRVALAASKETRRLGVWFPEEPPPEEWAWESPLGVIEVNDGKTKRTVYTAENAAEYVARVAKRRPGESADTFYSMFALWYQQVSFICDDPVAVFAQGLGESENTIYQYIHRARKRGFLPPRPGRSK